MKKRFILLYLIIFIFSASLVNSTIVFNNDFKNYNIGSVAEVDGYIESNQDVRRSTFWLYLECQNSIYQRFLPETIEVRANIRQIFSKDVTLLGKGQCNFKATFNGETQTSQKFDITDSLKGNMFLNKKSFKLGEVLQIDGDVLYLDNSKVNGVGIFSLLQKDSSEIYLADTFNVEDGSLLFESSLENLPPGSYDVIVESYDSYGNENRFNLGAIDISDKLSASTSIEENDYLPGGSIGINIKINENPTRQYTVNLEMDDQATEQNFDGSDFSYLMKTKENAKSGQHSVNIKITDDYGNYYEGSMDFNIVPVPKNLEIGFDAQKEYLPEDKVDISATIYDQADDLYEEGVINLKILDTKKNEKISTQINSGDYYNLELEKYIAPGSYTVTADGSNFHKEATFNVKELVKIDAYYEGNRLKIINEGNVEIRDSFLVYLDNNAITNFNLDIKPKESKTYDLRQFIKENKVYDLKIRFRDQNINVGQALITDDRSFSTKITGAVIGGGDFVIYALLLLIVVLIILFLFYRPKRMKIERERKDGYKEGQQKLRISRDEKIARAGKKGKEMNKDEVRDFRESIMKRMKE